jgi:NADH-quinone oxidoreductase subunit G
MKVHTKSAKAIGAQKATMEFLLINHPLDCPICDQGGECELQDLAMGYGRDVSRFNERKRVVKDEDIGPLVSTDMTRCIHCTRCVRFTEEIAGFQELGTLGRGDQMEIGTYIERAVTHELSGNIIDLCPVGALNSKPYRFTARAWEMAQYPTVAPHDCLGSNLYAHVKDGRVKRVVPRPNEELNETWISDRDRFSYEGIYAADRLEQPMLRDENGWRAVDWDEALEAATAGLRGIIAEAGGNALGALVSPSATVEEGFLLARLLGTLGSANLDHRLRRRDFRGQEADAVFPWLGMRVAAVEELRQALIVGCNLRREVPLLGHRIRKAAVRGAGIAFINPQRYEYLFPVADYLEATVERLPDELAKVLKAATGGHKTKAKVSAGAAALLSRAGSPEDAHRRIAAALAEQRPAAVFLGQLSLRHPRLAELQLLAAELARLTGAALGFIPEGANSAGLSLAGVLPHREAGGRARQAPGATAEEMLRTPPRGLLLFGVEPEADFAHDATDALQGAALVVALTPFLGEGLRRVAHIALPIATFAETSGTFVNAEGRWQSFAAVGRPVGAARPGWKVLRVLADRLGAAGCDFNTGEAIRDELRRIIGDIQPDNLAALPAIGAAEAGSGVTLRELEVPMYAVDPLVRRARPLQLTPEGRRSAAAATLRRIA